MLFARPIQSFDEKIVIYLNNLGSETWDGFWLTVTDQFFWIWFYLLIVIVLVYKLGLKKGGWATVLLIVIIALNDQFINFVKEFTGRDRPCHSELIQEHLRILKCTSQKSFFSAHAANSFLLLSYVFFLLKNNINRIFFMAVVLWALFFTYSRLYLGLHYPSDIMVGMTEGALFGYLAAEWFKKKFRYRRFFTGRRHT